MNRAHEFLFLALYTKFLLDADLPLTLFSGAIILFPFLYAICIRIDGESGRGGYYGFGYSGFATFFVSVAGLILFLYIINLKGLLETFLIHYIVAVAAFLIGRLFTGIFKIILKIGILYLAYYVLIRNFI